MATQFARAGLGTYAPRGTGPSLFDRLADGWRSYWRYQRTWQELSRLTDRELADIGLERADIEATARGQRAD